MTNVTHDLILTPILRLQIAQGTTEAGKPSLDLIAELRLDSGWSTLKAESEERGLSLADLDRLAEQWSRWEIDPKAPLTEYGRHTHICDKGHKPRWKEPTSPVDEDWGFKRRDCEDYKEIVF